RRDHRIARVRRATKRPRGSLSRLRDLQRRRDEKNDRAHDRTGWMTRLGVARSSDADNPISVARDAPPPQPAPTIESIVARLRTYGQERRGRRDRLTALAKRAGGSGSDVLRANGKPGEILEQVPRRQSLDAVAPQRDDTPNPAPRAVRQNLHLLVLVE